jgi:dolichol-phosphate mannosyltransferase
MIYFIIPVYNEILNITELANDIINVLPAEQKYYLFIDDCSSDESVVLIKQLFHDQNITILQKERNIGPGDSFNRGFEWVLQHSQDIDDLIVTIEADNTSDITILPTMIAIARIDFDLVMASVYAQGGGFDKTNIFRKVLSFTANMLFRLLFDIKILTLSSFYRVYRINLIRDIKNCNEVIIYEHGFISMFEILLKSVNQKARIIEVPMVLKSMKRNGSSNMKIFRTMYSYLRFIWRFHARNNQGKMSE